MREPDYLVPSGWHEHGPFLFWLIATLRPRCFVELGTHHGYSYFTACQAVQELGLGTTCYAVDNWRGDEHAGFYGDEVFDRVCAHNSSKYSGFSQLLRANFDDAVRYFPDGSIDILHIDGRHLYEDVVHDFATWRQKLTDDAIVLFHDTDVRERDFGVWKFFYELRREYPAFEFKHNHGLGVIASGRVPAALAGLFAADEETVDFLRAFYALLGSIVTHRWGHGTAAAALQEQYVAKEAELTAKAAAVQQDLNARETELTSLRQQVADYEQDLAALRSAFEAERECNTRAKASHQRQVSQYQRWVDDIRANAAKCVKQLNETITKERQQSHRLEVELEETSRNRNSLINSTSWRTTEPMRVMFKRYPRATRSAINAVRAALWIGTFRYSRVASAFRARAQLWREIRIVTESGLFDADFYLRNNPGAGEIGRAPIWHYLVRGWWEGRRPHPLFDGAWYLEEYSDVAQATVNPLVHFVEVGAAQRRNPNPFFDTEWYITMNPDVISSGFNPVIHYTTVGAARLADPSPAFSTEYYLDQNPDVAALGLNPLAHYLLHGQGEGRSPRMVALDFANSRPVTAARIECRKHPTVQKETALFAAYSPDGRLKPHVRRYLEALVREGIGIILIVNTERAFVGDEPWLYDLVDGLFVRANEGFDFAAWAHVLRLYREIYRVETLYLLNDSVIGPVSDAAFHAAIERMRRMPVDVLGMTESHEEGWHIQSYFLALKRATLRSLTWHQFVLSVVSFADKHSVINNYEIKLAPALVAAGLTASVLFKAKSSDNTTLIDWRDLLNEGFPFIKVQLVRDELPGVDATGWRTALAEVGFETSIVDEVLADGAIVGPRDEIQPGTTRAIVPAAPRRVPHVAFIGPWNYDNGLGVASRGYMAALVRAGFIPNFLPIARPFHVHQRIAPVVEFRDFVGSADVVIVHVNPEAWCGLLTEAQRDMIRKASIRVGAFIWESQTLPASFDERMREVDAVWAPSSYCADIFRRATDIPVDVIRFPATLREPRLCSAEIAETKEWLGLQKEHKLILFAFDASSFLARKNPLALIAAFERTNLASAGWRLAIKTKLTSDDPNGARTMQAAVDACPGVCLIDRPIGNDAMAALMDAAEIYASPHSSEGFGLTIAEAMSIGKIVVATDYGGSRDFLDNNTGFPVRYSEWQISRDEGPYAKGTTWAKVDEAHLAECLIAAAALSDKEKQSLGERARQRIRETVSPDAVALEMRRSIETLLSARTTS